jgi:serine/threonine-protein kinase HipA
MTDKRLLVYIDLEGAPQLVGQLWARYNRGRETASFEYDKAWLEHPACFPLEPALALTFGPHHTAPGKSLFGAIGDSAPDRWGRVLIQRNELRMARDEQRPARTLNEIDYLLGVGDAARQGALRFADNEDGPFLAEQSAVQIPPLKRLRELLGAVERITADGGTDADIELLLAPGSSLGGARPKASIIDHDGHLAMAKFPQHDDTVRVPLWEALALKLAAQARIATPVWRIENVARRVVLLLQRFDRAQGTRIPFLSAMSMLDAADHEQHSYLEIADALRQYGSRPGEDCAQLWRRIVFSILISNTDDHLRNHAFLYDPIGGWRLAPAYDLNPMPVDLKPRNLSLAINEVDDTASLDVALEVSRHFGLKPAEARTIVTEVGAAVATWRGEARTIGLSAKEIERMASAFEHRELAAARSL